eukprot:jgi/Chrzof1/1530/Cz10g11100.t1
MLTICARMPRRSFFNCNQPCSIIQYKGFASTSCASRSTCTHARRRHVTAANSSAQDLTANSNPSSAVYDRAHNRKQLGALVQRTPRAITVIVGPRSSGKSTPLQDFVRRQGAAQSLAYIDCRIIDASTPTGFARGVVKLALPAIVRNLPAKQKERALKRLGQALAGVAAAVKMTEEGVLAAVGLTQQEMSISLADTVQLYAGAVGEEVITSTDMSTVFALYSDLLDTWAEVRAAGALEGPAQWPVLVVDEANVLMTWQDKHPTELQQLLRCFVAKCKQDHAAHVLLCTSEYGCMSWLAHGELSKPATVLQSMQ